MSSTTPPPISPLRLRQCEYIALSSPTNLYGYTHIHDPQHPNNTILLCATASQVYIIHYHAAHTHSKAYLASQHSTSGAQLLPLQGLPKDIQLISLHAFHTSLGHTLLALTGTIASRYELYLYGCHTLPHADLITVAQDYTCMELNYTPFGIKSTTLLNPDSPYPDLLISGSDKCIHVYRCTLTTASQSHTKSASAAISISISTSPSTSASIPTSKSPSSASSSSATTKSPSPSKVTSPAAASASASASTKVPASATSGTFLSYSLLPTSSSHPLSHLQYLSSAILSLTIQHVHDDIIIVAGCQDGAIRYTKQAYPITNNAASRTSTQHYIDGPITTLTLAITSPSSSPSHETPISALQQRVSRALAHDRIPLSSPHLIVGSALGYALTFHDMNTTPFTPFSLLPDSHLHDSVMCSCLMDLMGCGTTYLCIGTYHNKLLVYQRDQCAYHSNKDIDVEEDDDDDGSSTISPYRLVWEQTFAHPLYALDVIRISDKINVLAVITMFGVYIMECCPITRARMMSEKLELLEEIAALEARVNKNGSI